MTALAPLGGRPYVLGEAHRLSVCTKGPPACHSRSSDGTAQPPAWSLVRDGKQVSVPLGASAARRTVLGDSEAVTALLGKVHGLISRVCDGQGDGETCLPCAAISAVGAQSTSLLRNGP